MNETKRKILDASRKLFNQYGVGQVSQRRIAEHLNISPGNLTYHFKKSDDIVEALYFELVDTMDAGMAEVKNMNYNLKFIFKLVDILVESFFEYRFIFLDFAPVMRNHSKIKKHYEQLSRLRKQQFNEAVQQLNKEGIMRKEELPQEYDFLYERFQLISDFWISSAEIREEELSKNHLEKSQKLITQAFYPYLTSKGKKVFLSLKR